METALYLTRFLHYAAAMQLFGVAVFQAWLAPPALRAAEHRGAWIVAIASVALLLASGLLWLALTAGSMAGGWAATIDPEIIGKVLTATGFGRVWSVRLLLLALILGVALWLYGGRGWSVLASLSTLGLDGLPNSRVLLMKDFSEAGITLYTNYTSRKAAELEASPGASALFFWKELERQVRLRGPVEKTSREDSEAYFFTRPYESRIGAWVSTQSEVIPNRAWLDLRTEEFRAKYPDTGAPDCVPLPDFWGGYRIAPATVEFWQGRPGRKHDRFLYRRDDGGGWKIERLSP